MNAIQEISSFLLIGILVNIKNISTNLSDSLFVSDNFIDDLAKNTREIYVTAYDQEGIVVWECSPQ